MRVPLGGGFNVSNALAAATTALELGVEDATVVEGLSATPPVPGRFEVVAGEPFAVVVDYAHTPDALDVMLLAGRDLARRGGGRVIAVIGCGGDRDRSKRPVMGEVAAKRADLIVITSDNPRTESPDLIIAEVRAGAMGGGARVIVEPDRRAAIAAALRAGGPGDVIIVAGKGHELTQTTGSTVIHFDDREVIRQELGSLLENGRR